MFLANVYGRYLGEQYDFFFGPGVGVISAETTKTDASPNTSIKLTSGAMGCATGGARYFFGKTISTGVGLTSYYCWAGSYKKTTVDASNVSSDATVSKSASVYGGFLFLFIEWNEERTLI